MTFANDYPIWILLIGFVVMGVGSFVRPSMTSINGLGSLSCLRSYAPLDFYNQAPGVMLASGWMGLAGHWLSPPCDHPTCQSPS